MSKTTLRNFIVALVVLCVTGGGTIFFFTQILGNSQLLEEQIASVNIQNQQEASLLRLQRLSQVSQSDREELASHFLLRESDTIIFLSEMEQLAPVVGLSLETESLEQVSQDGKDWIQTKFNVTGSREDIQNFIQILEIIPYVSRLTSVLIEKDRSDNWRADVVIQVQLLNYDQ